MAFNHVEQLATRVPGQAKTDAGDALVIADAARVMPHTLRSVELEDETIAELEMIVGFDDDLISGAARISNRLACSPRSTRTWSASSARASSTPPS